jgi:rubrerythrin
MVSSKEWWKQMKDDQSLFNEWLIKQYRGEITAASRIEQFADKYAPDCVSWVTLGVIAKQERQHAEWVLGLLVSRGIDPSVENAEKRYWSVTLPSIVDFETGSAVGAHAEAMRLERIRTIVDDEAAPADVRAVFEKILPDEIFHEKTFRSFAGDEAMTKTLTNHQRGLELLGLES